jgi:hypothetical protein
MRDVIVLIEMSPQQAAVLLAKLAQAEVTLAAQELDYLMEHAEAHHPLDDH